MSVRRLSASFIFGISSKSELISCSFKNTEAGQFVLLKFAEKGSFGILNETF
jgi:hypothetical protein